MEAWDAITSRRNVRRFTAEPVPAESLERILEAGRRSPSSRNEQHWDFVVVTDRERLRRLSGVWRGAAWVADAPAAIEPGFLVPGSRFSMIDSQAQSTPIRGAGLDPWIEAQECNSTMSPSSTT